MESNEIIGEEIKKKNKKGNQGEVMSKAGSCKKRGCTNGVKRGYKSQISSHFGKPYPEE